MTPVMTIIQASFDALVIGGGPAGLAAATSLGRAYRRVAVFDSHEYRNENTDQIHNVLIHDGQHPERFRNLARQEIINSFETVTFIETTITHALLVSVRNGLREFELLSSAGDSFRGKKLVLATGSVDILPDITGFQDLWGDCIIHCLFCNGFEKRDKAAGILGLESLNDIAPALMGYFLSRGDLTIYTNGKDPTKYQFQDNLNMALARGCRLDSRKIHSFIRMTDDTILVNFMYGASSYLGFLMHSLHTRNRAEHLISQLGIETSIPGQYAMVKGAHGETNVRGCFVAGDTSTLNKTIAFALSSGMVAGTGAARQLAIDEGWEATTESDFMMADYD